MLKYLVVQRCLFGVDVDSFAVELAKVSLFLELELPLNFQLDKKLLLPLHLNKNIKSGNSLFYCNSSAEKLTKRKKIARDIFFDWQLEFPEVFADPKNSGFDAVICNPPYLFGENIPQQIREFQHLYSLAEKQFDAYWLFFELALEHLLKKDGYLGFIVPDAFLTRDYAEALRRKLLDARIKKIWHLKNAFDAPNVSAVVVILKNAKSSKKDKVEIAFESENPFSIPQNTFVKFRGRRFLTRLRSKIHVSIIEKLLRNSRSIGDIARISRGEELGKNKLIKAGGQISAKEKILPESKIDSANQFMRIIAGEEISRYSVSREAKFFVESEAIRKSREIYKPPKILVRKTGRQIIAALDLSDAVFLQSVYGLQLDFANLDVYYALLGLLNSKLIDFFVFHTFTAYKLVYPQFNQSTILNIPLPDMRSLQDAGIIDVAQKITEIAGKNEKENPKKIAALAQKIDARIFDLFELNREEKRLARSFVF